MSGRLPNGKLGPFRLETKKPHWLQKTGKQEKRERRKNRLRVYPETTWYYASIGDKEVSEFTTTWWTDMNVVHNNRRVARVTKKRFYSPDKDEVAAWLVQTWKELTSLAYQDYLERAKCEARQDEPKN